MRVLSLVFSLTGNTGLAAARVRRALPGAEWVEAPPGNGPIDLAGFDGVVLAAPAFYRGVPAPFAQRVGRLAGGRGQPALLVATYGAMLGETLAGLAALARGARLRVVAAHALLMPESYPPFVAKGWTKVDAPYDADLLQLDRAAGTFREALGDARVPEAKVSASFLERLLGQPTREKSVKRLRGLARDAARCDVCGKCRDGCPTRSIGWSGGPVFSPETCVACFGCYNRCPRQAIDAGCMKGRDGRYRPEPLGVARRLASEPAPTERSR